jgi:hypothetical protein
VILDNYAHQVSATCDEGSIDTNVSVSTSRQHRVRGSTRRKLVRKTHQTAMEARVLRLDCRPAGRHQSLVVEHNNRPKPHLDRWS